MIFKDYVVLLAKKEIETACAAAINRGTQYRPEQSLF